MDGQRACVCRSIRLAMSDEMQAMCSTQRSDKWFRSDLGTLSRSPQDAVLCDREKGGGEANTRCLG